MRSAAASARQRTSVFARTRPPRPIRRQRELPEELAGAEGHDPPGELDLHLTGLDHEQAHSGLPHSTRT